MSDKGFKFISKEALAELKKDAYVKGNENAKITWFEYSDLQCPFCAKIHRDGTPKKVLEKFGDDVNIVMQHFPLVSIHPLAHGGAQAMECIGEQKGKGAFYEVLAKVFQEHSGSSFSFDGVYSIAEAQGIDVKALKSCIESNKYADKVTRQLENGIKHFGVGSTPGNVLVNNATGEYVLVSGAQPADNFISQIEKLLK